MKARGSFIILALLLLEAWSVQAQTPPDSAVVDTALTQGGEIRDSRSVFGDTKATLAKGDTVLVLRIIEDYTRVAHEGVRGWLSNRSIMTKPEEREYRRKIVAQRRRARQKVEYIQSLREKGYTIAVARQTIEKNSAGGVSPGLGVVNISDSKTVKYLRVTWKLFNPVGDPTQGQNSGRSTFETRLVGPIEPEESGYSEFDNAWYSEVGSCVEIRRIEVEHIDGSSFTYVDDLAEISEQASGVRLRGDCSYKAQKSREGN
jgi:hypothetical protein